MFSVSSIEVTVKGIDKILHELKAATTNPYLLADLIWILGKSLKDKNSRDVLIQAFSLPILVRELLSYIVYTLFKSIA